MKVLLVNGSPNNNGCTYTGLDIVSKELNKEGIETEIFWIGKEAIPGCIACGACRKNKGDCCFNDKATELAKKMKEADGIIIGSPVYYASPNGNLLSLLDRAFYSVGDLKTKVGAAVVSCRRGGATATFDCLNKYFTISNMAIASSNYWNMIHGSKASDVLEDLEGVQTMQMLARNVAFLVKCINLGKENGLTLEIDKKVKTNYIR